MTNTQKTDRWSQLCGKKNLVKLSLLALSTLFFISCNEQKDAINAQKDFTKDSIDTQKEIVTEEAAEAIRRTDLNATIDKADIEAERVAAQAQLDADKVRADAEAVAAKAKVDAVNNQ